MSAVKPLAIVKPIATPKGFITLKQRPTPAEVDQLAGHLADLEATQDLADECVREFKSRLLPLIEKFGAAPDSAKKSLRLEGETRQLTASFGQSVTVDAGKIGALQGVLAEIGRPALFKKLFLVETRYVVAPTAQHELDKLKPGERSRVRAAFLRAQAITPRAPRVVAEKRKKNGGR